MWSNLFSSREVREVREVFFGKGSTAFAHFADFARVIDSHPFRVFGVFRGLFPATHHALGKCQNYTGVRRESHRCVFSVTQVCLSSRTGVQPESHLRATGSWGRRRRRCNRSKHRRPLGRPAACKSQSFNLRLHSKCRLCSRRFVVIQKYL